MKNENKVMKKRSFELQEEVEKLMEKNKKSRKLNKTWYKRIQCLAMHNKTLKKKPRAYKKIKGSNVNIAIGTGT